MDEVTSDVAAIKIKAIVHLTGIRYERLQVREKKEEG
jgi:hypothetical protein